MTKPNCLPKVRHEMINYVHGTAMDGGVISLDVAEDMGITVDQAAARLCYSEKVGDLLCVGKQTNMQDVRSRKPFKIFILPEEKDEYDGIHNS